MNLLSILPLFLALSSDSAPAVKSSAVTLPLHAASACDAVSRRDVQEALGRTVGLAQGEGNYTESSCDYAAGSGLVTITLQHLKTSLNVPAEVETLKKAMPEATLRETSGLGMRAFYLDIAQAGTQLHVIAGERTYLMVSVLGFGEPADVAAIAERIARTALQRM